MADEKGKGKSPEEEINQYLDILAMDPTSRVFARLAEVYRKGGRTDEAIAICREGLSSHPGYTAGQVVLARALFDGGKSADARGEIAKVVAAAPDNLTAQKLLAQIEVRLNDHAAAAKAYRMVQLLDPSDEEAQKYLAETGGGAPETPPSLPAYETPPIEAAPPPVKSTAGESADTAGEGDLPPGLTFEGEPEPSPVEPAAVSVPQGEAAAPVSTEPVFDLGELEDGELEDEAAAEEEPADDSPFEVFTRAPRHEPLTPATVEERVEPFPEIEIPEEGDLDAEPVGEEPIDLTEEATAGEAEELTEPAVDDVEPVVEEAGAEAEAAAEAVSEDAGPPREESADEFELFDGEEAKDRRSGGEPSAEGVFNTETLANLYISQGFYGKAADVYRQMLTNRPDDSNLRQKLEEVLALEKMQAPSVEDVPVPVAAERPPEKRAGTESPVIEELQRLLTKLKERPR